MQRKLLISLASGILLTAWGLKSARAQDQPEPAPQTKEHNQQQKPVQAYRLDFSLIELQDGKKTNSRHYSMIVNAGSSGHINIGTRVAVASAASPEENGGKNAFNTQYQYLDVGTRINAELRDRGNGLSLEVFSDISNIDTAEAIKPEWQHGQTVPAPVIRTMQMNGSTVLEEGKPIVVGSVDDPNSNRQFQLEVIATKLK